MSAESVDGVPLSAPQAARFSRLVAAAEKAGADAAGARSSAEGSWRILYVAASGAWERRAVATTSMGARFAQRPGEVAARPAAGVECAEENVRMTTKQLLIERAWFPAGSWRVLAEAAAPAPDAEPLPAGVLMRVSCVLGQVDTVNRNNRVYPRELMARELKAVASKKGVLEGRGMFALADHPSSSFFGGDPPSGSTTRIAGIQHTAEFSAASSAESPDVSGSIDIIDSENGREIAAVVRAGGALGISQRGWGSVDEDVFTDSAGRQLVAGVVQSDYHLEAWDFVLGPSADAGVTGYREHTSGDPGEEHQMDITLETLQANHPALAAALRAEGAAAEKLSVAAAVETAREEERAAAAEAAKAKKAEAACCPDCGADVPPVDGEAPAKCPDCGAAMENASEAVRALVRAVRETAGKDSKDLPGFVRDAAARPLPAAVEEARAPGLRSAALLKVLGEKAGHNGRVYRECAAKAFSADGAPAMDPAALEAAIYEALKAAGTPSSAPPRPGDGRVSEDGSDAAATAEDTARLSEINKMRGSAGLPLLARLPGAA